VGEMERKLKGLEVLDHITKFHYIGVLLVIGVIRPLLFDNVPNPIDTGGFLKGLLIMLAAMLISYAMRYGLVRLTVSQSVIQLIGFTLFAAAILVYSRNVGFLVLLGLGVPMLNFDNKPRSHSLRL